MTGVTLFALMRAFSSGAVALTGVEAISNAVPAFQRPEAKNAAKTLALMAVILGVFFFGISLLAYRLGPTLSDEETILSILGTAVFGRGFLYIVLQAATAMILVLAANTAFSGFPLLGSIIAQDGYLPRQFATRGDRLAFSNGIVGLAAAAAVLLVAFGGVTTALIPSTPLASSRRSRCRSGEWCSGTGACGSRAGGSAPSSTASAPLATLIVLLVVLVSKFTIGAWIPAVVIPLLVLLLRGIKRHYRMVGADLQVEPGWRPPRHRHTVVLYVEEVHQGVLHALSYARSLTPDKLVAVAVVSDLNDLSEPRAGLGTTQQRRAAGDHLLPGRGDRPGGDRLRRPGDRQRRDRRGDRADPRARHPPLVGGAPPQPDGPVAQGPAALPARDGGDVGALPARAAGQSGADADRPVTPPREGASPAGL